MKHTIKILKWIYEEAKRITFENVFYGVLIALIIYLVIGTCVPKYLL